MDLSFLNSSDSTYLSERYRHKCGEFTSNSIPTPSAPPPTLGGTGWTEGQPNRIWETPMNSNGLPTASSSGYPDASSAFGWTSPSPLRGGGNTGQFSRRYDGKAFPETQETRKQYALNSAQEWCLQSYSNNRFHKNVPIAEWFMIHHTYNILDPATNELKYVLIRYSSQSGEEIAVLSADEFNHEKFSQAMKSIRHATGVTKPQINALIAYLINQAPSSDIVLFPHHGFIMAEDTLKFISQSDLQRLPAEICPESVRIRKLLPATTVSIILNAWKQLFGSNPLLLATALIPVGSVLLCLLEQFDIHLPVLITLRPSDGVTAAQLIAMLQLCDYPVPDLECSEKEIQNYLGLHWDTPAPFRDTSFADEAKKIDPALRRLLKSACNTDPKNRFGRNVITLVSEHSASAAHQIAPDNTISLSMNNATLNASPEEIHTLTKLMESVVISTIQSQPARTMEFLRQQKERIDRLIGDINNYSVSYKGLLTFLAITAGFLKLFLQVEMPSFEQLKELVDHLSMQSNQILSVDQEIVQDFSKILSEGFRKGEFTAMRKQQKMILDKHGYTAVIDGNRLYLSQELLNAVLEQMSATHRSRTLINALKKMNALVATDNDTHPFNATPPQGHQCPFYWYDITAELLDYDIQHKLNNLDSELFWLSENEIPSNAFIPLLRDGFGRVAGKLIRQQDAENGHFYITGQSGAGKTYTNCQLMAKNLAIGHNVIAFDNSDSYSKDAMERNLPKEFADEKVVFIDIHSDGIPVDLFRIDRTALLTKQKKVLLDIINAGVGELSAPQQNTLRSALSDMLKLINDDERIRTGDILAMLTEEGATYESLRNRLEPLFEDIDEVGMSDQTWDAVFGQNTGKIIVIQTAFGRSGHGDQLIDMMVDTLFRYQAENPAVLLDIFIDELQNQNFSKESPIRSILKEGRKYNIAFYGSTQDYYPRNTELGNCMGKAGTEIFLRPTQNSENTVASELRFKKHDVARFDAMQRGDAIVKTNFYKKDEEYNIPFVLSGKVVPYAEDCAESEAETDAHAEESDD